MLVKINPKLFLPDGSVRRVCDNLRDMLDAGQRVWLVPELSDVHCGRSHRAVHALVVR